MSSTAFEAPISLELNASPTLTAVFALTHGLALCCLLPLPVPAGYLLPACLLLMYSGFSVIRRYARLTPPQAVIFLDWHPSQGWQLETRAGRAQQASLLDNSYVHPLLVILNFRCLDNGSRTSVLVSGDMLDGEDFRRLRAHLRWNRQNPQE